jgi:hypothetical protein
VLEEQLATQLQQRVGLSEQQARQAAQAVLDFVKERFPQLAPLLEGGGGGEGGFGDALGGMLNQ